MAARIKTEKLLMAVVGPVLLLAALGCAAASESAPTTTAEAQVPGDVPPTGTSVGERIPDFALNLADGSRVTSQDLISRGQPTFLFFFATW